MGTPYVYRLTDIVNGKRYIGCRYGERCDPSDLGVTYFTSRPEVSAVYRHNPLRFEKQIIVTGGKEFVIKVESDLIKLYDAVRSGEFYNRTNNRAIHPDDALRGSRSAHSARNSEGKSLLALKIGKRNVDSGWAAELGRRAKESGNLPLMAASAGRIGGKIGGRKGILVTNARRYRCLECGLTSTPAGMWSHQKYSTHTGKTLINN